MFQHQSLGIKVNIQVTKLVLLRQRPVSLNQRSYRKCMWSSVSLEAVESSGGVQVFSFVLLPCLCRWQWMPGERRTGTAAGVHVISASRGTLSSGPLSPLLHSPMSPGCRVDVEVFGIIASLLELYPNFRSNLLAL